MPPTTLTHPASERNGAADLEEAPNDSQDERGPEAQAGARGTGPRGAIALTTAVVFGRLRIEQCPCATSRTVGPKGAPMPSLDDPTRLTMAAN